MEEPATIERLLAAVHSSDHKRLVSLCPPKKAVNLFASRGVFISFHSASSKPSRAVCSSSSRGLSEVGRCRRLVAFNCS